MIVEIALCVGAGALVVLVGLLVPLLIQLRKPIAESEYLLIRMNAELPLFLKEMRASTETLNALVDHARGGVEHAAVLLHAAGTLGDTVQRVHETVQGRSRSFLVNLASIVAGFRATTGVVKTHIHREGGTNNGK
ncbi:MAG TPA: DUF948 domain-containing protein [Nitrospiraceae bacterium]|nr:DUF948 domain-containing protein [Nitrospiraceae bacterium]